MVEMPRYLIYFLFFIYACSGKELRNETEMEMPLEWAENSVLIVSFEGNNDDSDHSKLFIYKDSCIYLDQFADHKNIVRFNFRKSELDSILLMLRNANYIDLDEHLVFEEVDTIKMSTIEVTFKSDLISKKVTIDRYFINESKYSEFAKAIFYLYDLLARKCNFDLSYLNINPTNSVIKENPRIVLVDYSQTANYHEFLDGHWSFPFPTEILAGKKKFEINIHKLETDELLYDTIIFANCKIGDTLNFSIDFINGKYNSTLTGF